MSDYDIHIIGRAILAILATPFIIIGSLPNLLFIMVYLLIFAIRYIFAVNKENVHKRYVDSWLIQFIAGGQPRARRV